MFLKKNLCPKWISVQMNEEEKSEAKRHFFEKTGFPGVVMCIDGTHIKIIPPTEKKHLFVNRKGFCSLNAMIVSFLISNYILFILFMYYM